MRRLVTSLAAVAALTGPAVACINDSELPGHEREFRSSYQNDRPPSSSSARWQAYAPTALYSAGGALAVAAGFVTFRRLAAKG